MNETGCSGLVYWDDPDGWDREGDGRGVQNGEHVYTHGWFMSMYDKNNYSIVISLQLKFLKKLMLSNCGAGEDSWGPVGLQGDQTSQS